MSELAVIDAAVDAFGHPSSCSEPVGGSVESTASHGVTVTVGGITRELATIASADISLPSHAHEYTDVDGDGAKECTSFQSHTIDPSTASSSLTINGSPVYVVADGVATDPTTNGSIDITNNPLDTNVTN